jgi:hypothetical protein
MKLSLLTSILGLSALGIASSSAVVVATVATYDAATNANAVDGTAPGSASTVGAFTTAVATANGLGFGGVANFDAATFVSSSTTNVLDFTYAGGSKTLRVSNPIPFFTSTLTSTSSATAISGVTGTNANTLNRGSTGTDSADTTFTFGPITGGAVDEYVTQFAFTILARDVYTSTGTNTGTAQARVFTATAYFTDGTSAVASDSISNAKGLDDTFYSFTAPAGHSITSVFIDAATNGTTPQFQPLFDDLAFITTAGVIPEPSSVLLIGAGLGFAALRRRRA